jgi:hypothetical protein
MHLGDAAAEPGAVFHIAQHVTQEKHLAIARPGDERVLRVAGMLDGKTPILEPCFAAQALQIALPTLAVGGIAEHEVELTRREGVIRQRRVLRPADDVACRVPFAFE